MPRMIGRLGAAVLAILLTSRTTWADTCACLVVDAASDPHVRVSAGGTGPLVPLRPNMQIDRGDVLEPEGTPAASLVCDGSEQKVVIMPRPGRQPVPCFVGKQHRWVFIDRRPFDATQLGSSGPAVALLSPRNSRVLDARPVVRWRRLKGVFAYTVRIRGEGVSWNTSVTLPADGADEGRLQYPADAPALRPGVTYKALVEARGFPSDLEGVPGVGFSMIEPIEARAVAARVAAIRVMSLPSEAVAVAHVYAADQLHDDAIKVLEARAGSNALALRLLADEYRRTGQLTLAIGALVTATTPPASTGEPPADQRAALDALADLYDAVGDHASAARARGSIASRP